MNTLKLSILLLTIFNFSNLLAQKSKELESQSNKVTSKPYARYWWFASVIKEEDVKYNLDWLKVHGFGGVELAWVYPLNRFNKKDTSYTPRQEWLSSEWSQIVSFTKKYADSIGLVCDLTYGTLWPFGDASVTFEQATQKYGDPKWRQEITRSWQHPKSGYVIDHLSQKNYQPYFDRLLKAFPRPKINLATSYFIDSWEVQTERLWCDGFDKDFKQRFGYEISPYMDSIYALRNSRYHYDYMSLVSDKVLKFYQDFDSTLNSVGVLSRGQVSGAPCDLISGYALLDIPEGESMLFEPEFCAIPASAALLSGKNSVTSEAFTCLYGWPRDYIRKEQCADLKLVADALLANGINQFIWHGKAHNPKEKDTVNFYATTHIGDNSSLAPEITPFNDYLETLSSYMKKGSNYSDIAVYLPTEDAWVAGVMPKEKQFIWAWGHYEMRYVYFPAELDGYNPTWINREFLEKSNYTKGVLTVGNARYKALYIKAEYLDHKTIKQMIKLGEAGLPIILKNEPKEPGAVSHPDYQDLVKQLKKLKNVTAEIPKNLVPFITGNKAPRHWCRKDKESLYIFFPNPKANRIKFPLEYGQALETETKTLAVKLNYDKINYNIELVFEPYQSLLYKIEKGKIEKINIEFIPKTPIVKKRPDNYVAPWLVK
jgi:alpha-L-rhamnosidase